jgi:hypothetical protein
MRRKLKRGTAYDAVLSDCYHAANQESQDMGIIDSTVYTLRCPKCGTSESAKVLDKGSGWGGSSWQDGASFANFNTAWNGGGTQEPELVSATCRKCDQPAIVESGYGG